MKFEIKSRFNDDVLFSHECKSLKICVEAAIKSGTDLSGADLRGAVLRGADLRGAVLSGAVLRGAVLSGADLSGADLFGADLSGADLSGAVLSGAVLSGADLSGADLSRAVLRCADLGGADLSGADLSGAVLSDADLGEKAGKLKHKGFFTAGPLGSRNSYLQAFHTDKGIFIYTGCFFDILETFRVATIETHGADSKHGKLYLGLANLIEYKFSEEN